MTAEKMLSVKDIAERLGRHPESIRRMIRSNKFPVTYEVNKSFLIKESDFVAWLETQKRPAR